MCPRQEGVRDSLGGPFRTPSARHGDACRSQVSEGPLTDLCRSVKDRPGRKVANTTRGPLPSCFAKATQDKYGRGCEMGVCRSLTVAVLKKP